MRGNGVGSLGGDDERSECESNEPLRGQVSAPVGLGVALTQSVGLALST